ncbi:MAG: hypothetical protein CVV34_05475, partial [Methanomicrobiales archaeon HGW-Methanomicrobiales-5]
GEPKPQFAELAHKIHLAVRQRRAAASILNLERREADIINFLPDATVAIDTQGVVIAWNRAMVKMTGIPSDQILGKGNFEYSIPFYQERRPILIDLVLKEDPVTDGKYPAITRDGTTLYSEITFPHFNNIRKATFWFTASPLYDMQGTIIGAIESIREITERKQGEEGLARSRERLKRAEQVSGSGHWEFDFKTREVITSEGARSIYGVPDGYMSLREVQQIPLSEYRPMLDEALRALIEDNQRYDVEFRIKRPNDGMILDIHSIAEYDPTRRVVFGVLQDITGRRRAEDLLRENEQKFRSLVEYALEGIFIVDFQGTILFANKAAARTIESEETEGLRGRNVMEFIAPESQQAVLSDFAQVAQGHDAYLAHYHAISAKGKRISIESIGKVISYEGKNVDLISIRDVTEKTSAEEALKASEEKYRLLIENSHDIIYT